MQFVLLVCSYYGAPFESDKLIRSKKIEIFLDKVISKKFVSVKNILEILRLIFFSKNIKSVLLDYPYARKNLLILFAIFLKNISTEDKISSFLSARGNLTMKGNKYHFIKVAYWYFLSILLKITNSKLVCSSGYEKKVIQNIINEFVDLHFIVVSDYELMNDYFKESFEIVKRKEVREIINKRISNPNYKKEDLKILCPSRFSYEKGVFQLFKILSEVRNNTIDNWNTEKIIFDFCMDYSQLNQHKNLKISNFESINIGFKGWLNIESLLIEMSKYDVILIPSHWESFSVVALQSQLCKCGLVITSNSPWDYISKLNRHLPIEICNPLLSNMDLNNVIDICYKSKLKVLNNIKFKELKEYILKEAN